MKSTILLMTLLLILTSCGEKGDTAKTNFKLKLGAAITSPAIYTGGMIIIGRRIDGSQKFTLSLTSDLELTLQKGGWEFATIAWHTPVGGKKMTGPHICSYQQVELRDDAQSVTFNMNLNNCRSTKTLEGNEFVDSHFYGIANASSTVGFKKLYVTECSAIDVQVGTCSMTAASSTYQSFKVIIPSLAEGIDAVNVQELSECEAMSGGNSSSYFQLPVGGKNGFIRTNIKLFHMPNCTESASSTPSSYSYSKGLASTVAGYSMMAPIGDYSLGNSDFNFLSVWNTGGTVATAGRVKGDLYLISATSTSVPPASVGDYVFYNGTGFQTLNSSYVTISDGKVYFNGPNIFLYVKP